MKLLNKYISESLFGHDSIDDQIDSNYWETINKSVKSELCSSVFNFEYDIKDEDLNICLFRGAEIEINNEFINFIKKYNEVFKKINIYKDPKLNENTSFKLKITTQIPSICEDIINNLLSNLIFYKIYIFQDPKIKLNLNIGFDGFNISNIIVRLYTKITYYPNIIYIDHDTDNKKKFVYTDVYENFKNFKINFNNTKDKNKFNRLIKMVYIKDDDLLKKFNNLFLKKDREKLKDIVKLLYKNLPKPKPLSDKIILTGDNTYVNEMEFTIYINSKGDYEVELINYGNLVDKKNIIL